MPIRFDVTPTFVVLDECFEPPLLAAGVRAVDSKEAKRAFQKLDLAKRCGCYIFAIWRGKKLTPWYVGQATRGFSKEVFTDRNCKLYDEALQYQKTGKPTVMFVALPPSRGARNLGAIGKLERRLILECGLRNPNLRNSRSMHLPKLVIQGVLNSGPGKQSRNAALLIDMMGEVGG